MYPILTLLHGLSIHSMLYTCYLRLLLGESLPYDSLINTSKASSQATKHLLEEVQDKFKEDFGVSLNYRGRFDTIPLCVDTTSFYPRDQRICRKNTKLGKEDFIFLYIGRLSPLKAEIAPFLSMLKTLVERNPKRTISWVIAG